MEIIDKKIELIRKGTSDKSVLYHFIDPSLFNLRQVKGNELGTNQLPKIRAAISHLQSLEIHYKVV